MSPVFTINFRREAYQREIARARRRVIMLGVWVGYFGVIGVLLGLYGLNCVSMNRRVGQIERQAERLRREQGAGADWHLRAADIAEIEDYLQNPRRWRDRLVRLGTILPPNVRVQSIAVNPQNLTAAAEQNKLVISGIVRPAAGQDRMESVMRIVSTLQADSLFVRGYQNVRLASTRVSEGSDGAEFVIECR
jgi:Tfp pilus assembly protein PilN